MKGYIFLSERDSRMKNGTPVNVLFDNQEIKFLDRVTKEAGRSRAAVLKRLIVLADTPEGKRLLGITERIETHEKVEVEH